MGRSQSLPRVGPAPGPLANDAGCPILHVDMDAFFASVEVRRRPDLAGRPLLVGGTGNRGVVASASYEARRFGVGSAMPMGRALRLCPHAVVLSPDGAAYREASNSVMTIFRTVTDLVEPLSVDEAFLDVAGAIRRMGSPATIAAHIRSTVAAEQGLTCSVGVASTKFVAKLASTRCKPDGLLVVPADGVDQFLRPLPIGALWGVGARTEEQLGRIGLVTVGDLADTPPDRLRRTVGPAAAAHLSALAHGVDPRPVVARSPEKSIGAEETFDLDVTDEAALRRELLRLSEKTARRLRHAGLRGRTVSIKIRAPDFSTFTRARTLPAATDSGQDLYAAARALFDGLGRFGPVRLVGIRVEGLVQADATPEQLALGADEPRWREADRAVDAAVRRFGSAAVRPGSLIRPAD